MYVITNLHSSSNIHSLSVISPFRDGRSSGKFHTFSCSCSKLYYQSRWNIFSKIFLIFLKHLFQNFEKIFMRCVSSVYIYSVLRGRLLELHCIVYLYLCTHVCVCGRVCVVVCVCVYSCVQVLLWSIFEDSSYIEDP